MTFPEHLLELRLSQGLSQQMMADIVGIALRTYQYYERGQREPPLATLITLADYYKLSLDELVCRVEVLVHHFLRCGSQGVFIINSAPGRCKHRFRKIVRCNFYIPASYFAFQNFVQDYGKSVGLFAS